MFHVHDNDRWGVIAPEFLRNNTWFEALVIQLSTYMVKVVNRMNGQVQVPLRFFFNNLVIVIIFVNNLSQASVPERSKGFDSSSNVFVLVGSNPTGCTSFYESLTDRG
jgi:hypothetical protein